MKKFSAVLLQLTFFAAFLKHKALELVVQRPTLKRPQAANWPQTGRKPQTSRKSQISLN
jgi:hypothetical protein